ncbi:MAG: carboxypeptidase-like regulatory domain-containing protein, partial [Terracidiphilus sp.]
MSVLFTSTFFVPIFAQQTLGSLNGTVVDPSGAAVPGATVTATNHAINFSTTTTTHDTGFFQIFNLPIGTYSVKITHQGFDTTNLTSVPIQEARATTANATLKIGQVSESVTVTSTPLLNATDTTNGYTLDSAQIDLTPLATGSFTQIAVLAPGVNAELLSNLDSNAGLGNQPIWANGQRDTSNTFQVNGVDST